MAGVLLGLYFATLGILSLLGLHRLWLTAGALRVRRREERTIAEFSRWPSVVVQLPIFNEAFVAERAIRAVAALDYPKDRLEIQVLDDSTDETTALASRLVEELSGQIRISLIHRNDRSGFKAGALAAGLDRTSAEVVAIFDADFVPPRDFLRRVVPRLMADPRCGMVQARWGHLNRDASLLTRAQALLLDAHFGVEHRARAGLDRCFNFNGTAGVWRRVAILEAGGWHSDTLTEDMDLSYRAQLGGWRFEYADSILVPAELPESWAAFRSQQARWVRGSIETFKKHFGAVSKSERFGLLKRLEALLHLGANFAYLLMALLGVFLPAAVILRDRLGWRVPGGETLLSVLDLGMLAAGTCCTVLFYLVSMSIAPRESGRANIGELAFALCLGAGLSVSNACEVLLGLAGQRTEFARTPKRGDGEAALVRRAYRPSPRKMLALIELVFAAWFWGAIGYAIDAALWGAVPFLLLYGVGFAAVSIGTLREEIDLGYFRSSRRMTSVT